MQKLKSKHDVFVLEKVTINITSIWCGKQVIDSQRQFNMRKVNIKINNSNNKPK